MNSEKLWNILEDLDTKEILVMVSMSVRYLTQDRQLKLNDILKDIKNVNKMLER